MKRLENWRLSGSEIRLVANPYMFPLYFPVRFFVSLFPQFPWIFPMFPILGLTTRKLICPDINVLPFKGFLKIFFDEITTSSMVNLRNTRSENMNYALHFLSIVEKPSIFSIKERVETAACSSVISGAATILPNSWNEQSNNLFTIFAT